MFFKKNENENKNVIEDFIDICALLIHAAKIDENYSKKELEIIKKTLLLMGAKINDLNGIIQRGEIIEKNSNQILNFTKKIKKMNEEDKIKIIEALWQIIYSNDDADVYETNLMRRLAGLLYIDNKTMGDIKEKIKNKKS
tara:strand:- start:110 stop:529 length:420 start_codon:yes stop_codon:yes gene_type:complete